LQVLITKIAEPYHPAYGQGRKTETPTESIKFRLSERFFTPLLAPIIQDRLLAGILAVFGVAQLLLVYTGLTGWQCPIYQNLGITCPGCGMTTAVAMLLQGQWQLALQTHAFAPVILMVLMLVLVAIVLPASFLRKLSRRMERLEQKTGIAAILLLSMVIYWLLRIFDFI
jgi:hypothetical protein